MTVVPIRLHRRPPAQPLNHGARVCPGCQAMPLREHGLACPEVAAQQRPRLAYPAEARVFRGLLIGATLGVLGWTPLIVAFLIWSN